MNNRMMSTVSGRRSGPVDSPKSDKPFESLRIELTDDGGGVIEAMPCMPKRLAKGDAIELPRPKRTLFTSPEDAGAQVTALIKGEQGEPELGEEPYQEMA